MLRHPLSLVIAAAASTGVTAGPPVVIDTVAIGAPGNPADTTGLGAVTRAFGLGRFEVTNTQYVAFLNAVAADDTHDLFDPLMTSSDRGGVLRAGSPGAYTYSIKFHFDDKPVNATNWLDAARFCNWLHNGQPTGPQGSGTTEDGAYDMSVSPGTIGRAAGARWFLPTHDEWYKAAYYDPFDPGADAGGSPDYWFYPTRTDTQPAQAIADDGGDVVNPGPHVANHSGGADWNDENGNVTTVGGCAATDPWGTFDMGGNINEWTETPGPPIPANPPGQPDPLPTRAILGGDFANDGVLMVNLPGVVAELNMQSAGANIGFRVATSRIPGDVTGNGTVNVDDLVAVITAWGDCPATCPADLDGDCDVDVDDLVTVIVNWS